jgi:hypothetical protein
MDEVANMNPDRKEDWEQGNDADDQNRQTESDKPNISARISRVSPCVLKPNVKGVYLRYNQIKLTFHARNFGIRSRFCKLDRRFHFFTRRALWHGSFNLITPWSLSPIIPTVSAVCAAQ